MCILIHQPKDYCFTAEQLADFYAKNPDGFGAIVNHGDERGVVVYKNVGTLKEISVLQRCCMLRSCHPLPHENSRRH
jgi:hypothetical protein